MGGSYIGCKWHGCLVEHPYHAFGRGLSKAEDDAS
jgi:hypothetical protein